MSVAHNVDTSAAPRAMPEPLEGASASAESRAAQDQPDVPATLEVAPPAGVEDVAT